MEGSFGFVLGEIGLLGHPFERRASPRVCLLGGEGTRLLLSIPSSEQALLNLLLSTHVHLIQISPILVNIANVFAKIPIYIYRTAFIVFLRVMPLKIGIHMGGSAPSKRIFRPLGYLLWSEVQPSYLFPVRRRGTKFTRKKKLKKKFSKKRRCLSGDSRKVKRHDRFEPQT